MATIDPDHPGTADSTREDDPTASASSRVENSRSGLAQRTRRMRTFVREPRISSNTRLRSPHGYFDISITCTIFRTESNEPAGRAREPGPRSASATSSAPQEETGQSGDDRGCDHDAQGQVRGEAAGRPALGPHSDRPFVPGRIRSVAHRDVQAEDA